MISIGLPTQLLGGSTLITGDDSAPFIGLERLQVGALVNSNVENSEINVDWLETSAELTLRKYNIPLWTEKDTEDYKQLLTKKGEALQKSLDPKNPNTTPVSIPKMPTIGTVEIRFDSIHMHTRQIAVYSFSIEVTESATLKRYVEISPCMPDSLVLAQLPIETAMSLQLEQLKWSASPEYARGIGSMTTWYRGTLGYCHQSELKQAIKSLVEEYIDSLALHYLRAHG